MGQRRLITDLPTAEVQLLASRILSYVTEPVRAEHAAAHEWHHAGSPLFFDGHREFIGKLETWLRAQGLSRFIPLPKWDPAIGIPAPLQVVKVLPAVTAAGFGPSIANPTPALPMPKSMSVDNLPSFRTVNDLSSNTDLQNWHGNVHVTVGGAMGDVMVSPCAAIFWPWHSFIDDIYQDWLALHTVPITSAIPLLTHTMNVFSIAKDGRLLQFYSNPQGGKWELYDVSALAGGAPPITMAVPLLTHTVNVFAVAKDGRLLQFYYNAQTTNWELYDISALAGGAPPITTAVPFLTHTVNVCAVANDGRLLQFYYNAQTTNWELYDVSALAGGAPPIRAAVPFLTQTVNVCAVANDGRLLQFYYNTQTTNWELYDISALASGVAGPIAATAPTPNLIGGIFAVANGRLVQFHFNSQSVWEFHDVSVLSRG